MLSAILLGPVGFIMRFGSVAIVFSIALYPRKDICFCRLLIKEGVDYLSALFCLMLRWVMAQGARGLAFSYRLFGWLHSSVWGVIAS